ncbi:hypothetical protein KIH41_04650 [Litoribacter ruber]|uniref:glycosyltransferase n=1 Tax=Litoribacter ruber TaxID=702568 RepID=UPI001BD9B8B4|nr:glycosyltransferase [Litoribacter ruber]MBT0810563.1 hypothetical protein [Litoribacter ruber]
MISIIICTINPTNLLNISKNIENTIGVPYEIVAIDNTQNPKGLTAIYNEGSKKAKYENVCFVHEDVKFQTQDWGKVILKIFTNEEVGLVGVAGSSHKPKIASGWGALGLQEKFIKINLIQHFKFVNQPPIKQYQNTENEKLAQVACLDGVLLISKKSIIEEFPFDEKLLKGFHCYDIDLSLAIGQKYKVAVTYEILIDHFSEGKTDVNWIADTILIHDKWKNILPISINPIDHSEKIRCEKHTYKNFIRLLRIYAPIKTAFKVLNSGEIKTLKKSTYWKLWIITFRIYFLEKHSKKPYNKRLI